MSFLTCLPDEIIEKILIVGDPRDILTCVATCRKMYRLVAGSMRLQLIIEAFASMYHLCPGWEERQETSRSIQDVLTKLKQTRSPSERMRGKLSLLPPRREDERCINTMQDDQFWVEYTSTPPDSVEESQTTTNGHLKFYLIEDFEADLPTASYVSPRHTLECPEFSYCVLDISEDLIILEESAVPNEPDSFNRILSLRSFSTGDPHPRALYHKFPQQMHGIVGSISLRANVKGRLLFLIGLREGRSHMEVWDWTTGKRHFSREDVTSYHSLTDNLLIVAPRIEMWTESAGGERASFEVWDIFENVLKATLELPVYERRFDIHFCSYQSLRSGEPLFNLLTRDESAPKFITVDILSGRGSFEQSHLVVISVTRLLEIVGKEDIPPDVPYLIPWATWGPQATRWLTITFGTWTRIHRSFIYLQGHDIDELSRLNGFHLSKHDWASQGHSVIFDFNPRNLRRAQCDLTQAPHDHGECQVTLVEDALDSRVDGVNEAISSNLPFQLVVGPRYDHDVQLYHTCVTNFGVRYLRPFSPGKDSPIK